MIGASCTKGFRLIPVLDIRHGQVVRAFRGRRHQYQPWNDSIWTSSADPQQWAQHLLRRWPSVEVYVADLDALRNGSRQWQVIESLVECGLSLWYEAGVRDVADCCQIIQRLARAPCRSWKIVVGLETWQSPQILSELVQRVGPQPLVFSLDMLRGVPLARPAWPKEPQAIVEHVRAAGIQDLILLDLDKVGTQAGVWAGPLIAAIKQATPDIRLYLGGGVRDQDDIVELVRLGCDGALVGTALHTGRLPLCELDRLFCGTKIDPAAWLS